MAVEDDLRTTFLAILTSDITKLQAAMTAAWVAWNIPDDHDAIHELLAAGDAILEAWQGVRTYFNNTMIPTDDNLLLGTLRSCNEQTGPIEGA